VAFAFSKATKMKTWVYVDGFNLYYGSLKGTTLKWLNLVELAKQLVPSDHAIERVKYFTARVSGANDPGAPRRQQIYLSALATLPQIEIHQGRFLSKTNWRPLTNLPVASAHIQLGASRTQLAAGDHSVSGGSVAGIQILPVGIYPRRGSARPTSPPSPLQNALIAEVHMMEEKGSDVNLASHLLNDAWKNSFDVAVVISNDTDLITPIQMTAVQRGKPVTVVCPGRWQMAPGLSRVATFKRHIHKSMLVNAQFPDTIAGTTISKPTTW
jgi:uncharacterized LabA/DUF88 family protein